MVVVIIAIFFANFLFPNFFPTISYYLYSPVWYINSRLQDGAYSFTLKPNVELMKENLDLREKNAELLQSERKLNDLQIENIDLTKFSGSEKNSLASVIAKPNVSVYDTILLDIGENKSVEVGDYVTLPNDIVIGQIIETHKNFSKASLLSTPGTEIKVSVGSKNIQTIAYGQGNGNLFIKLPKDLEIKNGDLIRIQELGDEIIGSVTLVQFDDSSAFTKIIFSLPTNIYEMRWVKIRKVLTK